MQEKRKKTSDNNELALLNHSPIVKISRERESNGGKGRAIKCGRRGENGWAPIHRARRRAPITTNIKRVLLHERVYLSLFLSLLLLDGTLARETRRSLSFNYTPSAGARSRAIRAKKLVEQHD